MFIILNNRKNWLFNDGDWNLLLINKLAVWLIFSHKSYWLPLNRSECFTLPINKYIGTEIIRHSRSDADLVVGRTDDLSGSNTSTPSETVSGVHNDTRNSGRSEQPNCRARRNTRKSNGNAQLKETTIKKTKSTAGSSNTKSGSQKKRNVLSASISLEMQRSAMKKKLNLSLPLTM